MKITHAQGTTVTNIKDLNKLDTGEDKREERDETDGRNRMETQKGK